jgi:hypothetical protein
MFANLNMCAVKVVSIKKRYHPSPGRKRVSACSTKQQKTHSFLVVARYRTPPPDATLARLDCAAGIAERVLVTGCRKAQREMGD